MSLLAAPARETLCVPGTAVLRRGAGLYGQAVALQPGADAQRPL